MKTAITTLLLIAAIFTRAGQQNWSSDTFVVWPQKPDAPRQTAVVSFSDWLVFGDATFGKPGVRFIINKMAASGIRNIWWRTFGGGNAQYTSKVNEVTMANYAGQGADYAKYDSLKDAVEYAHKLGLEISAWYTPLEEAHGWADNVRSRYTDLHKDMWDRNMAGAAMGAPSFYYKQYRDYKLDLAREMLCDYDIDGMVIDFERRGAPGRNNLWGYLPEMVNDFNRKYHRTGQPQPNDPQWEAYRAENVGKFMRDIKKIAKTKRKRPASVSAIFPAAAELSANYDIPRWSREKIIDQIGLIAHGGAFGYPSNKLTELKNTYSKKYQLPIFVILYSLMGSEKQLRECFNKAVAGGVTDIVWFETTYLYFNKRYNVPLEAACPRKAELFSPEYDLSQGGELAITAAGNWELTIDNKLIGKGEPDKVYKISIPKLNGRKQLKLECCLPDKTDKAGIAVQGMIGSSTVHSNAIWTSPQGKTATLAQPGIPPFLAPLDTAISGGAK